MGNFLSRGAAKLVMLAMPVAIVGCQQQGSMVGELPAPNFNGPVVAKHTAPTPTLPPITPIAPAQTVAGVPRAWIPATTPRPWKYIVIHHSATPTGGASAFDKMHREKGWDELGYHFVIGNGTDTGDGQVEVGSRWPKQKWGAHTKTPDNRYNDYGIGICLVGNFDVTRPTSAEMKSLAKLVAYLMKTYNIPASQVIGHGQAKATDCPGKNMRIAEVKRLAMQAMAESGDTPAPETLAATGELLESVPSESHP